jgi:hypothetical protein
MVMDKCKEKGYGDLQKGLEQGYGREPGVGSNPKYLE